MNLNSFMPVRLVTGAGCVRASAKELKKLGNCCLIVSGKHAARASGASGVILHEGGGLSMRFLHIADPHLGKPEYERPIKSGEGVATPAANAAWRISVLRQPRVIFHVNH
jgi:hypothetical protein